MSAIRRWLQAESARERKKEQRADNEADEAFHQGMADAYDLTIREGERCGWWIEP